MVPIKRSLDRYGSSSSNEVIVVIITALTVSSLIFEARTASMLYFIGLGLSDERDITVKGLDIVKSAARVYLEAYTSILMISKEKLVRLIIASSWLVLMANQGIVIF